MTTGVADANFLLAWRNLVLYETDATWQLDEGTVAAGSLSALGTSQLSDRVTITASAGAFSNASIVLHWFVDESRASMIQLIGLLNYALSAPAATSIIVDLSVLGVSGAGDVVSQTLTQWERPSGDFPNHLWAILEAGVVDGYWVTLEITAPMGAEGGTLTMAAGGLWAGPLWWLPHGIATGWKGQVEDAGTMRVSKGRQGYASRATRGRVFVGRAIDVDFEYAYGSEVDPTILDIQQLQFRVGTTEPVVIFPRTRNRAGNRSVHVMHRLGVYGHFRDLGWITEATGDKYHWSEIVVGELM
jgi:hypothetical protein